jgi:hypothetical protein
MRVQYDSAPKATGTKAPRSAWASPRVTRLAAGAAENAAGPANDNQINYS